jgi:hypothetical protein
MEKKEHPFTTAERELLTKLKESQFAIFNGDANKAYDTVEKYINDIFTYPTTIAKTNIRQILMQDTTPDITASKNEAYLTTKVAIENLNKICLKLGLPPIVNVNTEDKAELLTYTNHLLHELFLASL